MRRKSSRLLPPVLPHTVFAALAAVLVSATFLAPRGAWAEDAVGPPAPSPSKTASKGPLLWVIDGAPRIYLFGTIHVPDPRVLALSASTKAAFAQSDVAVGEMTLEDIESPEVAKALEAPEGKTLADLVPKDVMERLEKYLKDTDKSPALFAKMNPMGAAIVLLQLEMIDLLSQHRPMDVQFHLDAKAAGKKSDGLETAKEQLAAFTSPSPEAQVKFLDQTVKLLTEEHAAKRNPLDLLIDAYLGGDLETIAQAMEKMDPTNDPDAKAFVKRLVGDRNVVMVDRLLERAKASPDKTMFVFVGAGHFAGADGILALLEKKGIKPRRLGAEEKLPARASAPVPAAK